MLFAVREPALKAHASVVFGGLKRTKERCQSRGGVCFWRFAPGFRQVDMGNLPAVPQDLSGYVFLMHQMQ